MCGICGIISKRHRRDDTRVLQSMAQALRHRGPDQCGLWTKTVRDTRVSFAHQRLAILDLSERGRQPMQTEDGQFTIAYNGEVFNFLQLRQQLEAHGERFISKTDTEVILKAIRTFGRDIIKEFNGFFALAVWDHANKELLIARDHCGKKPLYYYATSNQLIFSSELRSLLRHPDVPRTIDPKNLSRYLQYEHIPAPHSIISGVQKLSPGHWLTWKDGKITTKQYWQINVEVPRSIPTYEEACEAVDELLSAAVKRRLTADVPLGVFLSGGVDSTAITSYASKFVDPGQLKTFSIGFREASFDESSHAREVAKHFGTTHYEEFLTPETMLRRFDKTLDILDEPMSDASIFPTHLLTSFSRQHVTVALGGDGADELFAGYDPFVAERLHSYWMRIPSLAQKSIGFIANSLPVSTKNMGLGFKVTQFLRGALYPTATRQQIWLGAMTANEQAALYQKDLAAVLAKFDPLEDLTKLYEHKEKRTNMDWALEHFQRYYMVGHILNKVDTASMAVSQEVRAPFLDLELIKFVNSLPFQYKMRGLGGKRILKSVLREKAPAASLSRKKQGFGIPLTRWFRHELRPLLEEIFSPSKLQNAGIFNPIPIQELLQDHISGKKDNRKQLFTLLMLLTWKDRTLDNPQSVNRIDAASHIPFLEDQITQRLN